MTEDFVARQVFRVVDALDRLTRAVEKQRTLVPLVLMVPSNTTAEQAHQFLQQITHALREAGLMPPEEGSDG